MCFVDYEVLKSLTLNGSSAIRCFECSDAIEIRDGILFNFYTGLSHNYINCTSTKMLTRLMIMIFIAHILLSVRIVTIHGSQCEIMVLNMTVMG